MSWSKCWMCGKHSHEREYNHMLLCRECYEKQMEREKQKTEQLPELPEKKKDELSEFTD